MSNSCRKDATSAKTGYKTIIFLLSIRLFSTTTKKTWLSHHFSPLIKTIKQTFSILFGFLLMLLCLFSFHFFSLTKKSVPFRILFLQWQSRNRHSHIYEKIIWNQLFHRYDLTRRKIICISIARSFEELREKNERKNTHFYL